MFGGVYAKDTYKQAAKQAKLYVVDTDPSWSPGEHWFVVDHTQEPCVVFDSHGARSPTACSECWQGTLGTAHFLMMLYKVLQQMCAATTVSFI